MRGSVFLFLAFSLWSLVSGLAHAAIPFTGNAGTDFPAEACTADPGGKDVGIPPAFAPGTLSGFDLRAVCFSYDPASDILYVGLRTYEDPSGNPILFGDADGDGNPSSPGVALQTLLGNDTAHLAGQEYITMAIDFNADNAPDLVVGTNTSNSLGQFQGVGGVAAPDNNLLLSPLARFYGAALAGVSAASNHLPSAAQPHLEFSVSGLSASPGFAALNFADPDSFFQFYLSTGSLEDDGIAEEFFPNIALFQKMKVDFLTDADSDAINDALDSDDDNDTIPDLIEKNLSPFDANGNGKLDAVEVLASGRDADGDGDIDTNDGTPWPDTDADGTPDFLDLDSEADGLPDRFEAGNPPARDSDGDGIFDFRETDSDGDGLLDASEDANQNGALDAGETDPAKFDTDGDLLCDGALVVASCTGAEISKGTNPRKVDTDEDGLCDGSVVVSPCVQSEGNLGTNPLNADSDGDGLSDGIEFQAGRDPLTAESEGISRLNIEPTSQPPQPASNPAEPQLGGDVDLTKGAVRLQGAGCSVLPGFSQGGMLFWWVLLLLWFGFVPRSWGLDANRYRSSMDGLGFLGHDSAKTLKLHQFSVGLTQHLSHNPIGFGLSSTGQSMDNVVNYFYVWDLWGALGVYENWEIGLHFPVSLITQIEDLNSTVERNTSSVGDIRLQGKWGFLKEMAVQAFINFPSGNSDDFFGEDRLSAGLKIIGEKHWGGHEVGSHLGVLGRGNETIRASNIDLLEVGPEMLWGAAWRYPFSPSKRWSTGAHLWGSTDFGTKATTPAELDFGVQKLFDRWPVEASLGIGFGLTKGYGAPTYRLLFGLSYLPEKGERKREEAGQAQLKEKEIVILKPIHFETGKALLREESLPVLDDVARLMEQNRTILKVRIDGHTDSDGSEAFNERLSDERAKAVKEYLAGRGIDAGRLAVKGWGERQPRLPNDSEANRSKNRRVEFHVVEVER